jgi:hypothetical protein
MDCLRVIVYTLVFTTSDVVHDQIFKAAMKAPSHSSTDRARIQHAMGLTPEQRVLAGFEQSELAIDVVKDGIRDQNPDADETTIQRMLVERVKLMRKIQNRRVSES